MFQDSMSYYIYINDINPLTDLILSQSMDKLDLPWIIGENH